MYVQIFLQYDGIFLSHAQCLDHLLLFIIAPTPFTEPIRYGPIYYEAFKLEDRDERDGAALSVVKNGLGELPRYGPLWFGLLKIVERRDRWEKGGRKHKLCIKYIAVDGDK